MSKSFYPRVSGHHDSGRGKCIVCSEPAVIKVCIQWSFSRSDDSFVQVCREHVRSEQQILAAANPGRLSGIEKEELFQRERANARENRIALLKSKGIVFDELSNEHFRISHNDYKIDFWPSTGRWKIVGNTEGGINVQGLVEFLIK